MDLEISKHDDAYFRRQIGQTVRQALLSISPRARWGERGKRAAAVLRSFTLTVDANGQLTAGWEVSDYDDESAQTGDLTLDLTALLTAVGEAAQDKDKGLVLVFDEVQFLRKEQLEAVIAAIHKCVQRELPVTLVAAGLPQIAELAGEAKSYAERLFKFPSIGELSASDARTALDGAARSEDANYDDDALDFALELTGRYPYFLQELGYAVWGVADGPTITLADVIEAQPTYEAKLDSSFFASASTAQPNSSRRTCARWRSSAPEPQLAGDVAKLLGARRSSALRRGRR